MNVYLMDILEHNDLLDIPSKDLEDVLELSLNLHEISNIHQCLSTIHSGNPWKGHR